MIDMLHFSRNIPVIPMQRRMNLSTLVSLRNAVEGRPSWPVIFMKAFALLCSQRPMLRRSYLGFPWPRLYQHHRVIASVAIAREYEGEPATFFTRISSPELETLQYIDARLRAAKNIPMEHLPRFRHALRVSRLPRPIRRLLWWWGFNTSGKRKEHYGGTFAMSITAGHGAASLYQPSPYGIALNYGTFDGGEIDVRLMYDHRIWDGAFIAKMLVELELILNYDICVELRAMSKIRTLKRAQ